MAHATPAGCRRIGASVRLSHRSRLGRKGEGTFESIRPFLPDDRGILAVVDLLYELREVFPTGGDVDRYCVRAGRRRTRGYGRALRGGVDLPPAFRRLRQGALDTLQGRCDARPVRGQ